MTIQAIRFRAEGDLLVLQVLDVKPRDGYSYGTDLGSWRDAKTTDLLDVAPFCTDSRQTTQYVTTRELE